MDRRMSEVGIGAVGLFLLMSAAFLFVQPDITAYCHFAAIAAPITLLSAVILYFRIANFDAVLLNTLIDRAPAQLAFTLSNRARNSLVPNDFYNESGRFTEQPITVLPTQFENNQSLQHRSLTPPYRCDLTDYESTWRMLRAELAALEDQFYTDMQRDANSSSNWGGVSR